MAWIADLSPCGYFGKEFTVFLQAVGWLERGKPFSTGSVDREVYRRLVEALKDPWQPLLTTGLHGCDLCLYESSVRGTKNAFIPGEGVVYVCPELIAHYMNAHGYAPPAAFCHAVLDCPPMRSMPYFKALVASGGRPLVRLDIDAAGSAS